MKYTKIVSLIFVLLFLSSSSMAQNAKMDAFYAKYRHRPNTISMLLPGWLVRFGLNLSNEGKDLKDLKPLMRGLNSLRVMVMEDENHTSPKDVQSLIAQARKHHFNDLISVREADSKVNIMIKTKKTKKGEHIKNVLILVSEADEFVLVSFNGRWKKDLLEKLLQEQGGDFLTGIVGLN